MFCKRAAEITNFLAAAAAKLFDLDQSRAGLGCGGAKRRDGRAARRRSLAEASEHGVGGTFAILPGAADGAPERRTERLAGEPNPIAERLGGELARALGARNRG